MTENIPYAFQPTAVSGDLQERFGDIEDGTETSETATVAGRLMLRRVQGKLAFGTLQDSGGRIQLFAPGKVTPNFSDFCELSLGDWIGVTPDKFHGLNDPDTRYRQRYVDLWVTPESRSTFVLRSKVISLIRRWLEDREFMEVETPMLHPIPGGAAARPFSTHHNAFDQEFFLRIAPELYLKRLVAGGFERVFEIGRVFRNEGISTRHNPEFTMLELYQAYADYEEIMTLTEELVSYLAVEIHGSTTLRYGDQEIDLSTPWRRASMTDLIYEQTGVELSIDTDIEELRAVASKYGVEIKNS